MAQSPVDSEPDSSPSSIKPWKDQAQQQQQEFFMCFGDCLFDSYRRRIPSICNLLLDGLDCKCLSGDTDGYYENGAEMNILRRKIGFAIFRQPEEEPNENNKFTGYPKDKLYLIEDIFLKIVKHQRGNEVLMALVFVSLQINERDGGVLNCVVFRIPHPTIKDEFYFVDCMGRLYQGWNDFLNNNKLPGARWCYPKDGVYCGDQDGLVEVGFGKTPAARFSGKLLNAVDTASCFISIGAGIGVFFPPVAAVCAGTGIGMAAYGVIRGSVELADRGKHGQSLKDREAFRHWIALAGATLGAGSAGGLAAVRLYARGGEELTNLVSRIVNVLNLSSMFVNGVSIVEGLVTLVEQREWNALQCFQAVTSLVFFAHSVVNFKTARSVYHETQTQILEDHSASLSKKQRKVFTGMQKETLAGESDPMVGRAKIIKDLNHISNKNEFFARILRSNKEARRNSEPVQKMKFSGEHVSQEIQSSSFQNVVTMRPTGGFTSLLPQDASLSTNFVNPHEPALFTGIKQALSKCVLSSADMNKLLSVVDVVCRKWKYGQKFMWALRIVIDLYNCNSVLQACRLIEELMEFAKSLWNDLRGARSSHQGEEGSPPESDQWDEDTDMSTIVDDINFIPNLLCSSDMKEDIFHVPLDHRSWDSNGALTPEEYVTIGQNIFGILNLECGNFMYENGTASVYFEHVGLVTITSYVEDQKIVVKKFEKHCLH